MGILTDRRYPFAESADDVWSALVTVAEYQAWWPWLDRFDGIDFRTGSWWRCTVRAPLRYAVHFEIELVEVVAVEYVAAEVTGDIAGTARLELATTGTGSELWLRSDLESKSGPVAWVDRWMPRLAAASHDRILDRGFRQFSDHTGVRAATAPA